MAATDPASYEVTRYLGLNKVLGIQTTKNVSGTGQWVLKDSLERGESRERGFRGQNLILLR